MYEPQLNQTQPNQTQHKQTQPKQTQPKEVVQETSGISNTSVFLIIGAVIAILVYMRFRKGSKKGKGTKKGSKKQGVITKWFKIAFGGSAGLAMGSTAVEMAMGLFSIIFGLIGFYFIDKHNTENTKLLQEINEDQYIGIFFRLIAFLPWISVLFSSMGWYGGKEIVDQLF